MLQPSQLTDVASRYAAEIVELQSFLAKAGVPVGTPQAIPSITSRVQQDKAFHRDLIATLWVTTEGGDRQIGFADLLGVLAIASAGVHLASDAEEQDALELLQFLKELRRTQEAEFKPGVRTARSATPHEMRLVEEPVLDQVTRRSSVVSDRPTSLETAQHSWPRALSALPRNRWPLVIIGFCLLLVSAFTLWLYRRSPVMQHPAQQAAEATTSGDPSQGSPQATIRPTLKGDISAPPLVRSGTHNPAAIGTQKPGPPQQPRNPATSPPNQASITAPLSADSTTAISPPRTSEASASLPAVPRVPATPPPIAALTVKTPTRPAITLPVPASILSKWLGTPSLPQYASGQSGGSPADAPRRPQLLRRHSAAGEDPSLVAELQPLDTPVGRSPSSSNVTQVGSVRPTALGMMAANVLYSPAPPYPVAASAAHVTGEVKLQAEVDRDGTVTYARVVSGPPLLRDAALNALQQWRYRPYLSRGKAVPVTTLAVMDFQLP